MREKLTPQQREKRRADILALHAKGLKGPTIAKTLGIRPESVRYYLISGHPELQQNYAVKKNPPYQRKPDPAEEMPPLIDDQNPILLARHTLQFRLNEKRGSFWLDNVPASLDQVMREANRVRKANGFPTILGSPNWVVD